MRHCRFTHVCSDTTHVCSDTTQLLATYIDQDSFIHPNCIRWALSIVLINASVRIEKKTFKRSFVAINLPQTAVKGKVIAARGFPLLKIICSTSAYIA